MKNLYFISCLLIVIFLASCEKEDLQEQEYALLNLEIECIENNVNVLDFSEWFPIRHVTLLDGDDILFYSDESLYLYNNLDGSVNIVVEDIRVKSIFVKDNTAFICSDIGVHSFGTLTSYMLNEVSNLRCEDIEMNADNELLFMHIPVGFGSRIFKISEENVVEPFTTSLNTITYNLETFSNGEVWYVANGAEKEIGRLDSNGDLIEVFDSHAALIDESQNLDQVWFAEGTNELFLVCKPGSSVAKINKYSFDTQNWSTLLADSLLNDDRCISDDKYFDIVAPTYTDIVLLNGDLYISTTLASCRGFHKINVAGNTFIQCEDIEIIRADNILEEACFDRIHINNETNRILINSQRMIYVGDICE